MEAIVIKGGKKLVGNIRISGAKNAALPILVASILSMEDLVLSNVPFLSDIATMSELLEHLGVKVSRSEDSMILNGKNVNMQEAPYDIVSKMRASIWVLGALLGRNHEARVAFPGGCTLGARQIDLHIAGLEAMGVVFEIDSGYIIAKAPNGLRGVHFNFDKISVGATINLILAAVLAKGETVLSNAAMEPEIVSLCDCLVLMGAKIFGIGTHNITINGVEKLHAANYSVIADRIEAGTYMIAAAITKGDVLIEGIGYNLVENLAIKMIEAGVDITYDEQAIRVVARNDLKAVDVSTLPYPGFATDLQAQYMALMTLAKGTSVITENIFENRFMHVPELCRMGANITITGHHTAIVRGVDELSGAEVMASDLRASVALILAGLVASGETKVRKIHHLDRGYENLEFKLRNCGADIERVKEA